MDTMTLTIHLPEDVAAELERRAKLSGCDSVEFIRDLIIKDVNRPTFDEILVPVRNNTPPAAAGGTDRNLI